MIDADHLVKDEGTRSTDPRNTVNADLATFTPARTRVVHGSSLNGLNTFSPGRLKSRSFPVAIVVGLSHPRRVPSTRSSILYFVIPACCFTYRAASSAVANHTFG